ncbi:MAG: SBBP repeat-containing protein [Candidatus Acidiferrales bacterium]
MLAGGAFGQSVAKHVAPEAAGSAAVSVPATVATATRDGAPPTAPATAAVIADYGRLPLSFELNDGQTAGVVKFVARGSGYALFLTERGAVLSLSNDGAGADGHRSGAAAAVAAHTAVAAPKTDVIRMELVGASGDSKVRGVEPLAGTANYLIGNDPGAWRTGVATFARVRYAGVYPGVDLVYYGNQRQLEYDFVVAPGASARQVRVRFDGARRVRVGADGNLRIFARNGEVAFQKPVVYQMRDGRRESVDGHFVVSGKNEIGFALGNYDASRELVIDPVLTYSTYVGGTNNDSAAGIAVDAEGSAYIVGSTVSTDFPLKGTPYQATNKGAANGLTNIFVTKMNPVGSGLVYSTYIGGSGETAAASPYGNGVFGGDSAAGIVIDAQGNAYIVGTTYSTDFPLSGGALQKTNKGVTLGVTNAFVAKLNATGSALIYSTYLGGSGGLPFENGASPVGDSGSAIAVDGAGNAYVTGATYSADFPVTSGAFQRVNNAIEESSDNAFVSKINATGSALIYSTYLGGSAQGPTFITNTNGDGDSGLAIAVDSTGDAYVAGLAFSTDFPVTPGAFQTTNGAAPIAESNAFVTKLNPTGSALVYSTYFGGSGNYLQGPLPFADEANAIAIDPAGDAYIAGATNSSYNFPVSYLAFQGSNFGAAGGFPNAFVSELNPTGSELVSGTLLGGSYGGDGATGIAVDAAGDAFVAGYANSTDFPTTSNAFQNSGSGPFFTEVPHGATYLLYSTYLGAGAAAGIALDPAGNAYVTGTAGPGFPTIRNAFQKSIAPNPELYQSDAFVAKFAMSSTEVPTVMTLGANIDPQFQGQSVTFTAQVTALAGGGEPTGIVNFESGGAIYSKDLDSTGRASLPILFASSGTYGVGAVYIGDGTFAASSAGYTETVLSNIVNLSFVSGDDQRTGYGMTFPNPLVFEVTEGGVPRAGISVTFTSSDMRLSALRAVSGANGEVTINATPLAVGNLSGTASLALKAPRALPLTFAEAANPGLLTVTARNVSVPQGKPIPALTYSITGFLNGDKATVVSGAPVLSTVPEGTAVGTYPIAVAMGSLAATNYKFKLVKGTLTITSAGRVVKPVFTPAGNVFSSPPTVMMTDATPGSVIYYTTDGTTPTVKSTLYTGPITVTKTEVISAIGAASGYASSEVTIENYRVE